MNEQMRCVECVRALVNPINIVTYRNYNNTVKQIAKPGPYADIIRVLDESDEVTINHQQVGWFAITILRGNAVCGWHSLPIKYGKREALNPWE